MKYTKEMELASESGYCMPFEERDKDVEMTLGYGKQTHPATGQEFFHHGIDFNVHLYLLSALASGRVTGIGTGNVHGTYLTVTYGRYEVTYSHLSTVTTAFGKHVRAGQVVAISGELLHMEVRYKGEELNPVEFLTMLYANLRSTQAGPDGMEFVTVDMPVKTDFEKDRVEIENLLERYFPAYMDDMRRGLYLVPEHTELSLKNIFTLAASKDCFFESIPSMANPLGIGRKAMPMAVKAQNLLIADFLNYLALRHGIYLSSLTAEEKKKAGRQLIVENGIIDPLAGLEIDIQSFDIRRTVSVYPDRSGIRWWTKAWFNGHEDGEDSVEIPRVVAVRFINDLIEKDDMLEQFYPDQMNAYRHAIEQTREQLLGQMTV